MVEQLSPGSIVLIISSIFVFILTIVLAFIYYSKKAKQDIIVLKDGGKEVPITASFTGLTLLPSILNIASNNLNPKLILYPNHVVYRVIFTKNREYSQIKKIDMVTTIGTYNLILFFKDSIVTFTANVGTIAKLKEVLVFLQKKKIPLSEKALALLQK